jgi:Fe-S-cluster containining protein
MTFPCAQECCSAGVDVWPEERDRMIQDGVARETDFTGPEADEWGDVLYRTAVGARGCVFLRESRGCSLHGGPYKPSVCIEVPRDEDELDEMEQDAMLPCRSSWSFREVEGGEDDEDGG